MTVYKFYGLAGAVSVAGLASIDVQLDGEIIAASVTVLADTVTTNSGGRATLSFASTDSSESNDVRAEIMSAGTIMGLTTSGSNQNVGHAAISLAPGAGIKINAGERVYLHWLEIGTVTAARITAYLYVRDKGTPRMR